MSINVPGTEAGARATSAVCKGAGQVLAKVRCWMDAWYAHTCSHIDVCWYVRTCAACWLHGVQCSKPVWTHGYRTQFGWSARHSNQRVITFGSARHCEVRRPGSGLVGEVCVDCVVKCNTSGTGSEESGYNQNDVDMQGVAYTDQVVSARLNVPTLLVSSANPVVGVVICMVFAGVRPLRYRTGSITE